MKEERRERLFGLAGVLKAGRGYGLTGGRWRLLAPQGAGIARHLQAGQQLDIAWAA